MKLHYTCLKLSEIICKYNTILILNIQNHTCIYNYIYIRTYTHIFILTFNQETHGSCAAPPFLCCINAPRLCNNLKFQGFTSSVRKDLSFYCTVIALNAFGRNLSLKRIQGSFQLITYTFHLSLEGFTRSTRLRSSYNPSSLIPPHITPS